MKKLIIATTLGLLVFLSTETISITEEPIVEAETETEVTETEAVDVVILELPEVTEPQEPEPKLVSLGEFLLTAYCPCTSCSDDYGTQTSTGGTCVEGRTIAVDPRVIPYGTKVYINGHEYVAEDCGGLIKQKRIDIYFDSHEEASNIKYYAEVFILVESEEQ